MTLVDRSNVTIIYATNLFKNFDKAFFRRILYHIKYPLPTNKELVELWKFHLGNPNILERMKLASTKEIPKDIHNFSYAEIAEYSAGLTGGDIKNITLKLCIKICAGRITALDTVDVKNEIDTYNEKNGKGSVSLKKLDTGEKKATLTIAYRTAEDYQKFNDMELYTGSVAEALAAGYSFDGSFASVKNGKIKACESSAFLDDSSYKVVVIRGNTNVKVKGTICYVSTTNTSYVDAQTIAIKEGTSLLAAEKTTEGTESATEAAGTQIEETTGAVSDDDLIDVTEQESEVKFQFDEEDTSTDDATGEFSQVYTYIIYK